MAQGWEGWTVSTMARRNKVEKVATLKWRDELSEVATVTVAGVTYPYHPTRFEVTTHESKKER